MVALAGVEAGVSAVRHAGCRSAASADSRRRGVNAVSSSHAFGEVFGVAADAGQKAGLERMHPVQAQKVEPRHPRNPALLERSALGIQHREMQPAVVVLVARTVVVGLLFPKELPSASLSHQAVFVSRFTRGYKGWEIAH